MKYIFAVLASLIVVVLAGVARTGARTATAAQSASGSAPAPVVVELFTSEGCSSCPPADELLLKLESEQSIAGTQIIAVEEHVDYWNQQGWMDPFSSSVWTARQEEYSYALKQNSAYTPEMIVAGRNAFVGSRSDSAVKAIHEARAAHSVSVEVSRTPANAKAANEPQFRISVGKLTALSAGDSAEVWIGITESGLASQVAGGENAGRSLRHASVLRTLKRVSTADARSEAFSFQGDAGLKLRPEWKMQNLAVVVLVQEKKSRHILGAGYQKLAG